MFCSLIKYDKHKNWLIYIVKRLFMCSMHRPFQVDLRQPLLWELDNFSIQGKERKCFLLSLWFILCIHKRLISSKDSLLERRFKHLSWLQIADCYMTWFLQDINLKEDHPLAFNLTFSISLGLLPVLLSLRTTGCGIKTSEFPVEEQGDTETSSKDSSDFLSLFHVLIILSYFF